MEAQTHPHKHLGSLHTSSKSKSLRALSVQVVQGSAVDPELNGEGLDYSELLSWESEIIASSL